MQRRQNQVTRQAIACTAISRGFEVADFADHDDVGVLAQDRAQAAREGHLDLGVDLGLADAVDVVLDRIFDRQDVAARVVDALEQRRVKRGGLARTRRTGDEQDAVRPVTSSSMRGLVAVRHAELRSGRGVRPACRADASRRARRDLRESSTRARRPRRPAIFSADAAVLRQALLGDVELGHDLDAADHGIARRPSAATGFRAARRRCGSAPTRRFSYGSMWMSDAPSLTASVSSALMSRMIGASSSLSMNRGLGQLLGHAREVGAVVEALDHRHRGAAFVGRLQVRIEGPRRPRRTARASAKRRTSAMLWADTPGLYRWHARSCRAGLNQHAVPLRERERQGAVAWAIVGRRRSGRREAGLAAIGRCGVRASTVASGSVCTSGSGGICGRSSSRIRRTGPSAI